MKSKIVQFVAIAFSLFLFFSPVNAANAVTQSQSTAASKAADKVVEEKQVKNQFGVSQNGEDLIDQAREKASQNLDELAGKAKSNEELPESQEIFLENLQGK